MNKKIRIRRIDKTIPLPAYKTPGASGFDFSARARTVFPPRAVEYVPLNVVIEPPEGHFTLLAPRSSLHKRGLMPANGIGVIDRDYAGNGDEYIAALFNFTDHEVVVEVGERIMQGVFIPHMHVDWEEVDDMGNADRGGFGTTGNK